MSDNGWELQVGDPTATEQERDFLRQFVESLSTSTFFDTRPTMRFGWTEHEMYEQFAHYLDATAKELRDMAQRVLDGIDT